MQNLGELIKNQLGVKTSEEAIKVITKKVNLTCDECAFTDVREIPKDHDLELPCPSCDAESTYVGEIK